MILKKERELSGEREPATEWENSGEGSEERIKQQRSIMAYVYENGIRKTIILLTLIKKI